MGYKAIYSYAWDLAETGVSQALGFNASVWECVPCILIFLFSSGVRRDGRQRAKLASLVRLDRPAAMCRSGDRVLCGPICGPVSAL